MNEAKYHDMLNQQEAADRRLRWRCRRGLLELDIVLAKVVDNGVYSRLEEAEQSAFDALLEMPDNLLWDMIAGKQDASDAVQQHVLLKIRSL